jgi:argininosuccinate lyase
MPHKKNPDVFELIRAKCNKLQAVPQQISLIINNLPSGYFRDMQITKECFIPAFEELNDCLQMASLIMPKISINQSILDDSRYDLMFSVEAVNELVKKGMPFRDAYKKIGDDIAAGTHEGSIGNLCNNEIGQLKNDMIAAFHFEKRRDAENKLLSLAD